MIVWGINALNHDSSICVFKNSELVLHKKSTDPLELTQDLINECLKIGKPVKIYWYENPWIKKTRQLFSGQFSDAFDLGEIPEIYLTKFGIKHIPIVYGEHHLSHAAAGYYTSTFNDCVIFVADAIGEWDTLSIWYVKNGQFKKIFSKQYPYSLGLFYSAFTKLLGFKPTKDESIITEKSLLGDDTVLYDQVKPYLKMNLHRGVKNWEYGFNIENTAAAVQRVFTEELDKYIKISKGMVYTENVIFMGGCAYNPLSKTLFKKHFKNFYTMKLPGDAGSSIGCVLYVLKKKIKF